MIQTLDKNYRATLLSTMVVCQDKRNTPLSGHLGTPAMIWIFRINLFALRNTAIVFTMLVVTQPVSFLLAAERSLTLEQKLQRKVSVTWQGQQLATALERLTSVGQIPLWLDRRADRQQSVTMTFADLRHVHALEKIAQQQSLGFLRLDDIVYIGPQQTAQELPTLIHQARDQLAKLPRAVNRRWLQANATSWNRLSEPRTLAESWLAEAEIQLVGSELIAHDLWPAQALPPLPLVDRLVLLLAGFDLTCQIASDGRSCEVVPIARPLKLSRRRTVRQNSSPKTRSRRSSQGKSRQLFTLHLENQPLGQVLDQIAEQLQLEVVWTGESQQQRSQLVSCDVQGVGLDELLRSVLKSVGLQHQLKGKRMTLQAKP